jgi:hypothetical protein
MKTLILPVLALLYSAPSFALVKLVANCETKGDEYRVVILDNEGIGMNRTENLGVTVSDKQGDIVASYALVRSRRGSISFGRTHFVDKETNGEKFDLAAASTNERNLPLFMKLKDGKEIDEENVECTGSF